MTQLEGSVALVTGASSGIGRATSLALANERVAVGLLARRADALDALAAEIAQAGGRALALPADVADEAAVAAAVARLHREYGRIDTLIHSAGVGIYGPVEGYRLSDWDQTFATNVTGLFLTARAVLPHLRQQGSGQIVAISSGAGRSGYANLAAYSASKFAVIGFMESLAEEVGPQGIKCSTILPGSVLTEFGPKSVAEKRASGNKYLEADDVAQTILGILRQPPHAWAQQVNLWPF